MNPEDAADEHGFDLDTLCSQFERVRSSGATNMLAKTGVRDAAELIGFPELVEFIDAASNAEYMAVLEEMGNRR
jgi:hypothetical protein